MRTTSDVRSFRYASVGRLLIHEASAEHVNTLAAQQTSPYCPACHPQRTRPTRTQDQLRPSPTSRPPMPCRSDIWPFIWQPPHSFRPPLRSPSLCLFVPFCGHSSSSRTTRVAASVAVPPRFLPRQYCSPLSPFGSARLCVSAISAFPLPVQSGKRLRKTHAPPTPKDHFLFLHLPFFIREVEVGTNAGHPFIPPLSAFSCLFVAIHCHPEPHASLHP